MMHEGRKERAMTGFGIRKLVTAVSVAALLVSSIAPSAALATGGHRDHGGRHTYYAGHGGHDRHYRHRRHYRHDYGYRRHHRHWRYRHRHHRHGDGAWVVGALAGALVLGALLSRPAPPRRPHVYRGPGGAPLGNCLTTTGTGIWYGRPAQFQGTMCYDSAGNAFVIPGSERFVGYLR
jgi:hypothetical protein